MNSWLHVFYASSARIKLNIQLKFTLIRISENCSLWNMVKKKWKSSVGHLENTFFDCPFSIFGRKTKFFSLLEIRSTFATYCAIHMHQMNSQFKICFPSKIIFFAFNLVFWHFSILFFTFVDFQAILVAPRHSYPWFWFVIWFALLWSLIRSLASLLFHNISYSNWTESCHVFLSIFYNLLSISPNLHRIVCPKKMIQQTNFRHNSHYDVIAYLSNFWN